MKNNLLILFALLFTSLLGAQTTCSAVRQYYVDCKTIPSIQAEVSRMQFPEEFYNLQEPSLNSRIKTVTVAHTVRSASGAFHLKVLKSQTSFRSKQVIIAKILKP